MWVCFAGESDKRTMFRVEFELVRTRLVRLVNMASCVGLFIIPPHTSAVYLGPYFVFFCFFFFFFSFFFLFFFIFFFNDTATTEIYTLSLHDALPICKKLDTLEGELRRTTRVLEHIVNDRLPPGPRSSRVNRPGSVRSEEHTSELQSRLHLVCRLLLEKKKKNTTNNNNTKKKNRMDLNTVTNSEVST